MNYACVHIMSCLDITPPRYVGLRRTPNETNLDPQNQRLVQRHQRTDVTWHALKKTSTATQTTDWIPLNAHFFIKASGRFASLFAGGQLFLAWILQYEANWNEEAKMCGKKKKGGNFLIPHENVLTKPYPPTPWKEVLQVKHKIQNMECLKKKVAT